MGILLPHCSIHACNVWLIHILYLYMIAWYDTNVPINLSQFLFICTTANTLDTIVPPLLDRFGAIRLLSIHTMRWH
ncbi:hypothetical protein BGY98DRAFT_1054099, partial [Russula aff. rugulosa BPL654]